MKESDGLEAPGHSLAGCVLTFCRIVHLTRRTVGQLVRTTFLMVTRHIKADYENINCNLVIVRLHSSSKNFKVL